MIKNALFNQLKPTSNLLCHSFFKEQNWKTAINYITGYWIGYSMECFQANCQNEEHCANVIDKSLITYILLAITVFSSLFLPTVLSCLPNRTSGIKKRLSVYQNDDYPYSISRLYLRINEGYDLGNFPKGSKPVFVQPETRLILSFLLFSFLMHIFRYYFMNLYIPEKDEHIEMYGRFDEIEILTCFMNGADKMLGSFMIFFVFYLPFSVLYLAEAENNLYVFHFKQRFSEIELKKIKIEKLQRDYSYKSLIGYSKFSRKLLNRICVIFNLKFYHATIISFDEIPDGNWCIRTLKYLVKIGLTVFNFVFNFLLCALPLVWTTLSPFRFFLRKHNRLVRALVVILFCPILSALYLYMYRVLFISTIAFLLKSITFTIFVGIPLINIPFKSLSTAIAGIILLTSFYLEFLKKYRTLLVKSLTLQRGSICSKEISVLTFDQISETILPVRSQISKLFLKYFVTIFSIAVLLNTMSYMDVDKEEYVTSILPILLAMIPTFLDKFCATDLERQLDSYEDIIKTTLESGNKTDVSDKRSHFACGCGKGVFCGVVSFLPITVIFTIRLITSCFCPCFFSNCWPLCICEIPSDELLALNEDPDEPIDFSFNDMLLNSYCCCELWK